MCSLHSYDSWQLLPSNDVQNSDSQKRPEFLVLFYVQKCSTRTERTKEMYRRAHQLVQIIIVVGSGLQDVCRRSSLLRENPITRNLELTLPDKRGVGNQICWNNARFFEYTGTNAFSRIQKEPIPQDGFRAKTKRFPTYQDLAVEAKRAWS